MTKRHSKILLDFLEAILEEGVEVQSIPFEDEDRMMRDFYSLKEIINKFELPIRVFYSKKEKNLVLFHWTKEAIEEAKKEGTDFDDLDKIEIEIVDE